MAKTAKAGEGDPTRRPKKEDIDRAISEASRHKASAAEYSGSHGQVVKTFCDRWNVSKKAFGLARQLHDMEEDKRQATIRDFLFLTEKLGYLDQKDMFDDVGHQAADAAGASKLPANEPDAAPMTSNDAEAPAGAPEEEDPELEAMGLDRPFSERLRKQNDAVDKPARAGGINAEIDQSIGVH